MGSTGTHLEKGQTIRDEIAKLLSNGRTIVADTSRRTGDYTWPLVYIAAVRESDGRTWALVSGYRRDPGWWNLTYRTDDETVGPGFSEFATTAILDALTPTDSEWANQWRDAAREAIQKAKDAPKVPAVKPGTVVKLARALSFQDGVKADTFTMVERFTFTRSDGRRVRLPASWKKIGFEVVA